MHPSVLPLQVAPAFAAVVHCHLPLGCPQMQSLDVWFAPCLLLTRRTMASWKHSVWMATEVTPLWQDTWLSSIPLQSSTSWWRRLGWTQTYKQGVHFVLSRNQNFLMPLVANIVKRMKHQQSNQLSFGVGNGLGVPSQARFLFLDSFHRLLCTVFLSWKGVAYQGP